MKRTIKKLIKDKIESSIENFFKNKKVKVTHVLDQIFPVERKIRSLIGGLETSLGTTVWEPIAKELAQNNGFEINDNKKFLMPTIIPNEIQIIKSSWEEKRHSRNNKVSLAEYVDKLRTEIISVAAHTSRPFLLT